MSPEFNYDRRANVRQITRKPDLPSLQERQRDKEMREREKRRNSTRDEPEVEVTLSSEKIKEELIKNYKNYKPKRSAERNKKKISLTNPVGYRIANKPDRSALEHSLSFRPEKELQYRYGSYKMVHKSPLYTV